MVAKMTSGNSHRRAFEKTHGRRRCRISPKKKVAEEFGKYTYFPTEIQICFFLFFFFEFTRNPDIVPRHCGFVVFFVGLS